MAVIAILVRDCLRQDKPIPRVYKQVPSGNFVEVNLKFVVDFINGGGVVPNTDEPS